MLIDPGLLQRYLSGMKFMARFDPMDDDILEATGLSGVLTEREKKVFRVSHIAACEGAIMLLQALLEEKRDDPSA